MKKKGFFVVNFTTKRADVCSYMSEILRIYFMFMYIVWNCLKVHIIYCLIYFLISYTLTRDYFYIYYNHHHYSCSTSSRVGTNLQKLHRPCRRRRRRESTIDGLRFKILNIVDSRFCRSHTTHDEQFFCPIWGETLLECFGLLHNTNTISNFVFLFYLYLHDECPNGHVRRVGRSMVLLQMLVYT